MKTTKVTKRLGLAVITLMAIVTIARADNTLTYTKTDENGSGGEAQKMMIRAGKMRIDLPGGKNAMIFDAAANKIFILEIEAKKYMVMDPAMMKQMMLRSMAARSKPPPKMPIAMHAKLPMRLLAMNNVFLGACG